MYFFSLFCADEVKFIYAWKCSFTGALSCNKTGLSCIHFFLKEKKKYLNVFSISTPRHSPLISINSHILESFACFEFLWWRFFSRECVFVFCCLHVLHYKCLTNVMIVHARKRIIIIVIRLITVFCLSRRQTAAVECHWVAKQCPITRTPNSPSWKKQLGSSFVQLSAPCVTNQKRTSALTVCKRYVRHVSHCVTRNTSSNYVGRRLADASWKMPPVA